MKVSSEGIGIDRKGRPLKGRIDLGGNTMFLVFAVIAVLVVGGIITDSFVDAFNLSRVFRQMAIMGLMAIGMTYVIIGGNGGIDLSVGSSFGLAAMISISLQNTEIQNTSGVPYSGLDLPLPVILLAVIGAGMLMGLANGVGVAKLKLPPFIMTMSTLSIGRGICLVYSNGFQFVGVREDFQNMGGGMIGDVFANTLIIFIVAVVISYFVLHKSTYGRKLFATGANIQASAISGVKTNYVIVSTYIISGALAALSGALFTAFTMAADPYAGEGYEIDAISAVLIGGTPMLGGQGIMGLVFITLIKNLLNHLSINSYIQQLITALLIMAVVLLQQRQYVKSERRA